MKARGKAAAATPPKVTDHALVRFLARSGVDVEAVRRALAEGLADAHRAARSLSDQDHTIVVDKMRFVIRGDNVVTVTNVGGGNSHAGRDRE